MLPLIEKEIVTSNHWLSYSEFVDVIGISQMTPGPIAINSATFVGYRVSGVLGSTIATLGVVTPSFILVTLAYIFFSKFKESKVLSSALEGMRPALIGLILSVFLSLGFKSYRDLNSIIIGLIIAALLYKSKLHPILIIVIAAVLGAVLYAYVPTIKF